jgi:hypothetical protein
MKSFGLRNKARDSALGISLSLRAAPGGIESEALRASELKNAAATKPGGLDF